MARLIVQELMSVDGYVADESGSVEFFDAASDFDEVDHDNLAMVAQVGTLLLGRKTYQQFVRYWPTADAEIMADAVNALPKVVFSSTLHRAPWGDGEADVVSGPAEAHVAALTSGRAGDLLVWGSISLAQSLLRAGLVDELQLRVLPIVLGGGRSLTGDLDTRTLELLEAKPYRSGIVSLRYGVGTTTG